MRILHFLQIVRPDIGGPATAVMSLTRSLVARGHSVTLATWEDSGVPDAWKRAEPGVPRCVKLPPATMPADGFARSVYPQLRALVEQHDVVHLHGVWEYSNIQIAAIARKLGKPYLISVRGVLDDWCMAQGALKKRAYLALAGRRYLEGAAYVHLTAQAELDQARKHFPRGRGLVIPNLLDLTPFNELPGPQLARDKLGPVLSPGTPTVLFLSRVHVKKGIEHLLRATALLKQRGVAMRTVIAGSGEPQYVQSLRDLAQELGVDDRAHFVGQVIDREKLSLYQAADLFVLPTSQENFGFVFIEALACGTPVVTTKGVDIWPELEASGGSVIASAEPAELARVIESMLARPDLRDMGARGRAWVYKDLDPARVLDRFEKLYTDALATGRA